MYIWIGLVFNKNDEDKIRKICREANKKYNINEQSFTLPQHISLKTSFKCENDKEIIDFIQSLFINERKLILNVENITMLLNKVIWLDITETNDLRNKHNLLNLELKNKYNIGLSGFDGEGFHFHSTLFQELEENHKMTELYEELKTKIELPMKIEIDSVCIGTSEIGKVGTYTVVKQIKLS